MGCRILITHRSYKLEKKEFVFIRKTGGSRIVPITNFLPKDWKAVNITQVKVKEDEITLKFKKVV